MPNNKNDWLKIENKSGVGKIYLMGDFTNEQWDETDITPLWFLDEVKKLDGVNDIHMWVNSDGGSVKAGLAIHDMIKNLKANVTTHIIFAASTASWAIMPSNKIMASKNSMIMTHLPMMGPVLGNKNDFEELISILDMVENVIKESYKRNDKVTNDVLNKLISAKDNWMTGESAYNIGIIDELESDLNITSSYNGDKAIVNGIEHDVSKYKHFPTISKPTNTTQTFSQITNARKKLFNLKKEAF